MRGVIFNFNGTLFNDSDMRKKAWLMFSKKEFNRDISDDEFENYVHDHNDDFTMEYLARKSLTRDQISRYVKAKETFYLQLCRSDRFHFHLTSGAVWLLNDLKERQIPITIAIASQQTTVDFYFENFHLDKWFEIGKIIYEDGTISGKPNPDFYIRAAQAINMPAKNCIVFENSLSGILSAYNAGIGKVIAISPRNRQLIFEQMKEVYEVIANFHEFDRILLRE